MTKDLLRKRVLTIWLFSGCGLVALMVIIGGITRLTHSGLSMVDWRLFMGSIPPITDAEWQVTFEQYKNFPEYQQINFNFSLEDFKSIFWWEYIHRLIGRLIGLVFLIPFSIFLIKKWIDKKLLIHLLVMFVMGGLQGLLGWYMVKSGLVQDPSVSQYRLAAHLMAAFVTCSYIFWVALQIIYPKLQSQPSESSVKTYRMAIWITSVVTLQIIYGAFVAGLKAGKVYNTFPKMDSSWLPVELWSGFERDGWTALTSNVTWVQFLHRYLAYIVVIMVLLFWKKINYHELNKIQKTAVSTVLGITLGQALLGIFTLIFSVPIVLGVAHQVGALALLMSLVFVIFHFRPTASKLN